MTAALRSVIAVAIAGVLLALASPWLRDALFVARLIVDEPPTALRVPVAGVPKRAIVDTWHAARPGERRHEGVDIFARRGAAVVSTTRGFVWRIGENALGGTVVWVLGPGGQLHYYAHLDRVAAIRARQRVEAGDVLGYVGNTGNAERTPPHLHYGIYRRAGTPLNPYPLIRGAPVGNGGTPDDASG